MSRRRTLADWRREVYRSTTLSDRTKVLLLFLSDHMREDRKVSLPRENMAEALGRSERRITERIKEAHDAGWLWTVVRGQKGITAVYQGLFPDALSGTDVRPLSRKQSSFSGTPTSPLSDAETSPLNMSNHAFSGTHGGPTITRADLSGMGADRNVSNDEEAADPKVHSLRAVPAEPGCEFHLWQRCPSDCRNHRSAREESA